MPSCSDGIICELHTGLATSPNMLFTTGFTRKVASTMVCEWAQHETRLTSHYTDLKNLRHFENHGLSLDQSRLCCHWVVSVSFSLSLASSALTMPMVEVNRATARSMSCSFRTGGGAGALQIDGESLRHTSLFGGLRGFPKVRLAKCLCTTAGLFVWVVCVPSTDDQIIAQPPARSPGQRWHKPRGFGKGKLVSWVKKPATVDSKEVSGSHITRRIFDVATGSLKHLFTFT